MKKTRIKIFIGTGGVGKTTLASAQGLNFAYQGFKVLVITIDPSLRLKTALNLKPFGVNQKVFITRKNFSGELWASLLDAKWVFDDFVKRGLKNEEQVKKLFKNRLYQQLSTHLNGSQEFTSLEKLLLEYESGQWDYIILDTPPAAHAIDFLKAPAKLNRLLDERISRWFRSQDFRRDSFWTSLIAFGTKQVMKVLEFLTGNEFIQELSDFFDQIQFWQEKLEQRLHSVDALLKSPKCEFILVTQYDLAKIQEGISVLNFLQQEGFFCHQVIINRAYPAWLQLFNLRSDLKSSISSEVANWALSFQNYYKERAEKSQNLLKKVNSQIQIVELSEYLHHKNIEDLEMISEIASTWPLIENH